MNNRPLTIALVAGENSGDILGARLIHVLKSRVPNARFVGIAGPLMRKEGCEAWYAMEDIAVMGIIEIFSRIYRLLYIRNKLTSRLFSLRPDVFIGIDAPDFNLSIERNLKKKGIKTIHYVSPSVWAWRRKRIFKIGKSADLVLVFLPFEKALYEKFNISCRFIGHSIADIMPLYPDKNKTRSVLGIPHNVYCLALLPGSREAEIEMLSADFLKAAKILRQYYPNIEIIVPLVNTKLRKKFECIKVNVTPNLKIRLVNGKSREILIASDVALLASGTATLECMLAKCPMVVCYKMNLFTFWIAKRLVKTNYISLPNLLANSALVEEVLQEKCKPQILAKMLLSLLEDKKTRKHMHKTFRKLHQKIRCNADEQAANAVLELTDSKLF